MMVYLDGKLVDAGQIDPALHRYVGMFRPPLIMGDRDRTMMVGALWNWDWLFEHYQAGHMDVPDFQTITGIEKVFGE